MKNMGGNYALIYTRDYCNKNHIGKNNFYAKCNIRKFKNLQIS